MLKTVEGKHHTLRSLLTGGNPMEIDGKVESARLGIAAVGVTIWGYTLNDWVAIATILYLLLQCLVLMPKIYYGVRNWSRRLRGIPVDGK